MTPAFVYNRMVFLENGVALSILALYYCLINYQDCKKMKWLYLASAFSVISMLSKINGIVAPIFFLAYSLQKHMFRKASKPILTAFSSFIFPAVVLLLRGSLAQWKIGRVGRELSAWQFLIINSMPSGFLMNFNGYLKPEYWYLFACFCIAYGAIKEKEKLEDIILMIVLFVGLCLIAGILGSYYLIVIQPFLAIPVGYTLNKMIKMSPMAAATFILFIYAPMTITLLITALAGSPFIGFNDQVYMLKILTIGGPLAGALLLFIRGDKVNEKWRVLFNRTIITLFLVLLVVGSYLVPAFYPPLLLQRKPLDA